MRFQFLDGNERIEYLVVACVEKGYYRIYECDADGNQDAVLHHNGVDVWTAKETKEFVDTILDEYWKGAW